MGSGAALDVFDLREKVITDYEKFARSFTKIHAEDIRSQVNKIYDGNLYWPEPLLQINPNYKRGANLGDLADNGELDPQCAEIFQVNGQPITLYKHQVEAVSIANSEYKDEGDGSYVVTTGTGSGKSLCFFIPIVNRILQEKRLDKKPRTRAIIIYPMNALANSQRDEIAKFLSNIEGEQPITIARYTGQDDNEYRDRIAQNPPDILLTNFMMLEMLMTRQDPRDQRVISNCEGLRFLVLDELHTYRGRQGADVALLIRRVRERLKPEKLQCIGTSATMASEGSDSEKNRIIADVASKLFSVKIQETNVINETLERVTDVSVQLDGLNRLLGSAIKAGIPENIRDAELRSNPLAIWVETNLGIAISAESAAPKRAKPQTITDAVKRLAADSQCGENECKRALKHFLQVASIPESERCPSDGANTRAFFAFKLHQFISGAGHAYATLEPAPLRAVTVEGQQFYPGAPEKRLYPVHFCRECGHEYHPVRMVDDGPQPTLYARSIDDAPPAKDAEDANDKYDDGEIFGFVTLHARDDDSFDFDGSDETYPDTWLEEKKDGVKKLKSNYRKARMKLLRVLPSGVVTAIDKPGILENTTSEGVAAWFIPGQFRFCLRCLHVTTSSARDRTRLAGLSAEGRSSATTILVTSALQWMHSDKSTLAPETRKLLGFTDNRQDAALQAGHFNDFIFVSLIRASFLRALQEAGPSGIRSEDLGGAQQRALGFDKAMPEVRAEWLTEPKLTGTALQEAAATLRDVLAHRTWYDQRRGWRYTNPNLEQLGLVEVDYPALDELASNSKVFDKAPDILRDASPQTRAKAYRILLDHMRRALAVTTPALRKEQLEQLAKRSNSRLRAPWNFNESSNVPSAGWLMVRAPGKKRSTIRDQRLLLRAGAQSTIGKLLRSPKLWNDPNLRQPLKKADYEELIDAMLDAASQYGLVAQTASPFDEKGWQLDAGAVIFRLGQAHNTDSKDNTNVFFTDLYQSLAETMGSDQHPIFGFESREHTAQVDQDRRQAREFRFRYGKKEQEKLRSDQWKDVLKANNEPHRFLPVLFCSPTMELGVDISALNVVYMRNLPPTPANYAQRSGRAGRSGQAALVLTYASAQGPHDQYFFNNPIAMVHGEVKAPTLDLTNQNLVTSHLQATWLSCVKTPLSAAIPQLLDLEKETHPVRDDLVELMKDEAVTAEAQQRIEHVLTYIDPYLKDGEAPWYTTKEEYAKIVALSAFDKFKAAFDRWRTLYKAAERQRDDARKLRDRPTAKTPEKRAADRRIDQAKSQIDLLLQGRENNSSDFYTYRYLATEGFLPGYNFPRLPLMAYIPASNDGLGRQTYLQRPRFLALAEFGPGSLVYHEGRAYRVVRAILAADKRGAGALNAELPTEHARICRECGGGHFDQVESVCHACGEPLSDAESIQEIYRVENVATQQAERITANDEERRRQGFELQTTFRWASRDGVHDVRRVHVKDSAGHDIARLSYGAGASITRLNKGLRRRANPNEKGFMIDPVTGYWTGIQEDDEKDPHAISKQRVVPAVRDDKNALLFKPADTGMSKEGLATLQYALLRGIETVFELEEGEVLAEPVPTRDERRGFLFYEATEGGAGVLTLLVSNSQKLAEVAIEALRAMHFKFKDVSDLPAAAVDLQDVEDTNCVAGCYRCLLSYFNQPDHELIDRRDEDAKRVLLRLARASADLEGYHAAPNLAALEARANLPSSAEAWLHEAQKRGMPAPDANPFIVGDYQFPLVWREHLIIVTLDALATQIHSILESLGNTVVTFGEPHTWPETFETLKREMGLS